MQRHMRSLASVAFSLRVFAGCSGGGGAAGPDNKPVVPACDARVTSIAIIGPDNIVVRKSSDFTAQPKDAAGNSIAAAVAWSSSDSNTAVVSSTGTVTGTAAGTASITVLAGCSGNATRLVTIALSALPIRGLYVQFDQRGSFSGYWPGQLLRALDSADVVAGTTVLAEASSQLDAMRAMGVNTISYELRSTDSTEWTQGRTPPDCRLGNALGLRWPQPSAFELQHLIRFFDLAQSKGIKVMLRLVNTHMEEQPPLNSMLWLGSILGAVKNHSALELVLFEGDVHVDVLSNRCGGQAEPALFLGPTSAPAKYVSWAISYAMSLGFDPRQLSAQAQVGFPLFDEQSPAGSSATDGHLWNPLAVMKGILDKLGVPEASRTYAMSFYEHRKCSGDAPRNCVDMDPQAWGEQMARGVFATIGKTSPARAVAVEMGVLPGENWTSVQAVQSLVPLMRKYGIDGGSFWKWVAFFNDEAADPTQPDPVKRRGIAILYNPVRAALAEQYGKP